MAEFESEALGVKFSLPDAIPVSKQLLFRGGVWGRRGNDNFIRFWEGAKELVQDWECELIADPLALDLDAETDPRIADIVQYVGVQTAGHITDLGAVPKNG